MSKPRNLNSRDHDLEIESISSNSVNELQVKAQSKLSKLMSIKKQIILIYAFIAVVAVSIMALGQYLLFEVEKS
jgi:hypothetical protein